MDATCGSCAANEVVPSLLLHPKIRKSECQRRMKARRKWNVAGALACRAHAPVPASRMSASRPPSSHSIIQDPGNNDAGAVVPAGIGACGCAGVVDTTPG